MVELTGCIGDDEPALSPVRWVTLSVVEIATHGSEVHVRRGTYGQPLGDPEVTSSDSPEAAAARAVEEGEALRRAHGHAVVPRLDARPAAARAFYEERLVPVLVDATA